MEPWEELDIDDSDVSSFVRPLKRQALVPDPAPQLPQSGRTLTVNPSPPASILRPCSQLPDPQEQPTSQPTPNYQILASIPLVEPKASPQLPQQAERSNPPRRIPGPAGAVQAAMWRKVRNAELPVQCEDGDALIPTQEYIRRVVEKGDEDDGDFALHPWVCAVDFIRREGLVGRDGVAIGTPLCSIKSGYLPNKVAQVVAVIKSCNPNGLGDLMVTLKDPTGSIGASIHRRVLNYGNFGKEISVGAVLILQKVAVFSPARCACYLNISLNNIIKVISKDIGPLSEQTCRAPVEKRTSVAENNEKLCQLMAAVPQLGGRIDGIMSSFRQSPSTRTNTLARRHFEQPGGALAVESFSNLSRKEHSSSTERELLKIRNHAESNTGGTEVDVTISSNAGTTHNTSGVPDNAEDGKMNGVKKQKAAVVLTSSVPDWTDEQLDKLLEFDA